MSRKKTGGRREREDAVKPGQISRPYGGLRHVAKEVGAKIIIGDIHIVERLDSDRPPLDEETATPNLAIGQLLISPSNFNFSVAPQRKTED